MGQNVTHSVLLQKSDVSVIGIDPSLRATGLAWRNLERCHYCRGLLISSHGSNVPEICPVCEGVSGKYEWITHVCPGDHSLISTALHKAACNGVNIAYIEDGYMGPNAKVAKQLDQLRGRIQERCKNAGLTYVMINPKTWQALMLGEARGRKELKAMSIEVAQDLGADVTGPNGKPSDDIADAVCLAEYGHLNANLVE